MPGERPTRTESIFVRPNVLPPLRPAPFFHVLSPSPSRSFARVRSRDSPRSHGGSTGARWSILASSSFPIARPSVSALPGINVINCCGSRYRISIYAARPTTITLPGEPRDRRRACMRPEARPEKHDAPQKRDTRVKVGRRDDALRSRRCLSPRRFFPSRGLRRKRTFRASTVSEIEGRGLIVNLSDSRTLAGNERGRSTAVLRRK